MEKLNEKVIRPWGSYTNIDGGNNIGYKVKKLVIAPGKRISLQSHKQRSEHWVIINGIAEIRVGDDKFTLTRNQSIYVPCGVLHRIENVDADNVEIIEVHVGPYLGEDDIERFDDDFGRT